MVADFEITVGRIYSLQNIPYKNETLMTFQILHYFVA